MIRVSHDIPLDYEGRGPFFIDENALQELDGIYKKFIDQKNSDIFAIESKKRSDMIERYLNEMEKEGIFSEEQIKNGIKRYEKTLTIDEDKLLKCEITFLFSNNKEITSNSFQDVFNRPEFSNEAPKSCFIKILPYKYSCTLFIHSRSIHLEAMREKEGLAEELYIELHHWITRKIEPPKWQRFWRSMPPPFIVYLFVLSLSLLLAVTFQPSQEIEIKKQIHEILKGGVAVQEQSKAIELLLKLHDTSNFSLPTWVNILIVVAAIVSIILSFQPPHILLGIGRGNKDIARWRKIINIIFYVVPSTIFVGFILPTLQELWKKFFSLG